jgi:hypothetical protein
MDGHAEIHEDARALLHALQQRVAHTLELANVEVQYATVSALSILFLVVIATAAVVIGWGLFLATALAALNESGFSWGMIAIVVAITHGVLAIACWRAILRLARNLSLPALRAALGKRI